MSISQETVATDDGEMPVYRSDPELEPEGSDLPALPPAWPDPVLRTDLIVMCADCSLIGVWTRRCYDADVHPHDDATDHTVEYATVGDLLDCALDRGYTGVVL